MPLLNCTIAWTSDWGWIIILNLLNGKANSFEASINSNVGETWVSTDCQEIRDISLEHGANVIKRPKEISGDKDKNELAIEHFLQNIGCNSLVRFDHIVALYVDV